jgi:hypothetical protein
MQNRDHLLFGETGFLHGLLASSGSHSLKLRLVRRTWAGQVYVALPDEAAAKHRLVRVIDESGEDDLYPQKLFAPVELPPSLRRAVLAVA